MCDLQMEINQASGDQSVWHHNGHSLCDITMGNDAASDIHCDVTMSNDVAVYTYQGITLHNDVAMEIFYYVFSIPNCVILLWVVWNKNKNKFMSDQSGLENTFIVFV